MASGNNLSLMAILALAMIALCLKISSACIALRNKNRERAEMLRCAEKMIRDFYQVFCKTKLIGLEIVIKRSIFWDVVFTADNIPKGQEIAYLSMDPDGGLLNSNFPKPR